MCVFINSPLFLLSPKWDISPVLLQARRQATLGTKRPLEGYNLPVYLLAPRRPGEPPGRHRGLIGIGKSSVNGGYSYYIGYMLLLL